MTLAEWGALPPSVVAPLYRREEQRWREALSWDTTTTWATIETARVAWGLPGFVCHDRHGGIRGWTFFMKQDEGVDIGGLVADTPEATRSLIDGLIATGSRLGGFVFATAPGLIDHLAEYGIGTERYLYLMRSTEPPYEHAKRASPTSEASPTSAEGASPSWRSLTSRDNEAVAELLRRAYGPSGRLFARHNTAAEWRDYVDNVFHHEGCGLLRHDLSRVATCNGRITAVALVTSLAPETTHLAQLAVDPSARRDGLGRSLVTEVLACAHHHGYEHMSLLVSNQNAAARALYGDFGFAESAEFFALAR